MAERASLKEPVENSDVLRIIAEPGEKLDELRGQLAAAESKGKWFLAKTGRAFKGIRETGKWSSAEEKAAAWEVIGLAVENALGYFPHPVQFEAAMVMEEGNVAQVPTGGGKSEPILMMTAIFEALSGKKMYVWTPKQDLVEMQAGTAAKLANLLGVPLGFTREMDSGLGDKPDKFREISLAMRIAGYSDQERVSVLERARRAWELDKLEEQSEATVHWLVGGAAGKQQPLMAAAEEMKSGGIIYSRPEPVIFETLRISNKEFKTNQSLAKGWSCLADEFPYILFAPEPLILSSPDLYGWAREIVGFSLLRKVLDEMLADEKRKKQWFKFIGLKTKENIPEELKEAGIEEFEKRFNALASGSSWVGYLPLQFTDLVDGALSEALQFGAKEKSFTWSKKGKSLISDEMANDYWGMLFALIQAKGLVRNRDYRVTENEVILTDRFACLTTREYQGWLKQAVMINEGLLPKESSAGHVAIENILSFQHFFDSFSGCSANASEYGDLIAWATEDSRVVCCQPFFGESGRKNPDDEPVLLQPDIEPLEAVEEKLLPILEEAMSEKNPILVMFPTDEAVFLVQNKLQSWAGRNGYVLQIVDSLKTEEEVAEIVKNAGKKKVLTLGSRRLEVGDDIQLEDKDAIGWLISFNPESELQAMGRMDRKAQPCRGYLFYYFNGPGGLADLADREGLTEASIKKIKHGGLKGLEHFLGETSVSKEKKMKEALEQATVWRGVKEELFGVFRQELSMPKDFLGEFSQENEWLWWRFVEPELKPFFSKVLANVAYQMRVVRLTARDEKERKTWVLKFGESFLEKTFATVRAGVEATKQKWIKAKEELEEKRSEYLRKAGEEGWKGALEIHEWENKLLLVSFAFETDQKTRKLVLARNYDGTPERLLEILRNEFGIKKPRMWQNTFAEFEKRGDLFRLV